MSDQPDDRFSEDPAPRRERFPREEDDDRRPPRQPATSSGGGGKIVMLVIGIVALVGCLIVGILVALLLPAVSKVRQAASRATSSNNLKQIGLAFHQYEMSHGRLPPAHLKTKDGRPGLSWRVELLPYLEQEFLYQQFKLDEPWDSPANLALLDKMPKTYAIPSDPPGNTTPYRVVTGPKTLFDPDAKEPMTLGRLAAMDGSATTILVVEADQAVPWTKPDELVYDPNGPVPALSKRFGGAQVGFADGTVRMLEAATSDRTLRALITATGGETLEGF